MWKVGCKKGDTQKAIPWVMMVRTVVGAQHHALHNTLYSALIVNVTTFKQTRGNGGSNFDFLKVAKRFVIYHSGKKYYMQSFFSQELISDYSYSRGGGAELFSNYSYSRGRGMERP